MNKDEHDSKFAELVCPETKLPLEIVDQATLSVINEKIENIQILKDGEANCGLVVDANNNEEIKEAIIKLRDNPELCEELGANARKAYEERYSWEIMERRLVDLYRELTGEIGQKDKGA